MASSSSFIPRCAVELLFAEDLIDRIMTRHSLGDFKAWRAAPYRDFIFNAFNDDIGEAVDFIDLMLEWEVDDAFSKMVDQHRVNRETFINFALYLEELYFKQGFDADNFLDYCVRLVSLAAYFTQYGKPLALELALFFIMKVITNYDLFEGGWDTLNAVAKKYVERKEEFCKILTPDVSDDEPLMNAPEDDEEEDDEFDFANNREEKPKGLDFLGSSRYENETEECISNVDDESAITQEEKPQGEPDRERMDLTGSKLDFSAISESKAEGYIKNVDDESAVTQKEKPQDKPGRETMDFSGSKLNLPTCAESKGKIKTSIPLDM